MNKSNNNSSFPNPDYYHLNDDVLGIEVHCTGVPRPKVQWFHDMFAITPSFKYTLLEEAHGVYKLEVYKPAAKDSGKCVFYYMLFLVLFLFNML